MAGVKNGVGIRGKRKKLMTYDQFAESDRAKREASKARMEAKREAKEALKAKEAEEKAELIDVIMELPIPDDGVDHAAWSPPARVLARLLSDPEYYNRSDKELAEACGLHQRTVRGYLWNPEFMAYAAEVAAKNFDSRAFPRLVGAIVAGMAGGRGAGKMVEIYAKIKGMLIERKVLDGNVTVKDERKTVEELVAEAMELERKALEGEGGVH